MTLKEKLYKAKERFDIDLLGFADVARFDTPTGNTVKKIMPRCHTVIGIGMRILRGSFRCVEEGSNYFQFHMAGLNTLEFKIMPERARRICALLEDEGYEALAQFRQPNIRQDQGYSYDIYYKSVNQGCEAENQMDFTRSAVLCGMGELGMSGHVLTRPFGPFVKFCFILTDADLEPDPIQPRTLCDECGKCREGCHTRFALREETEIVTMGDISYKVFSYNELICNIYYHGANRTKNPWMKPDLMSDLPYAREVKTGQKDLTREEALSVLHEMEYTFIPKVNQNRKSKNDEDIGAGGGNNPLRPVVSGQLSSSICGQACDRACYVHLEEEGKMDIKYINHFRTREPWSLDPDAY